MAKINFAIDRFDTQVIAGWVDRAGPVPSIEIELNDRWLCTLAPTAYRADLAAKGLGDGRRAFSFGLAGHLKPGLNTVALKADSEIFARSERAVGDVVVAPDLQPDPAHLARSQQRWKGDESEEGLTWGRRMDGSSLWDIYTGVRKLLPTDRILEVGPGYGRVMITALERAIQFKNYVGLELSAARVERLRERFQDSRLQFVAGDVNQWRGTEQFDVIISSGTFHHLYPDCRAALLNLFPQIAPGGVLLIDFTDTDESKSRFQPDSTFIRTYNDEELKRIFQECGYSVQSIVTCVLGEGAAGAISRKVVVAQK